MNDTNNRNDRNDALTQLLAAYPIPRWARVRLRQDDTEVTDAEAAVAEQLRRAGTGDRIWPGARVAITGGSRGIDRIAPVLRALVREVRSRGGVPFIVPAMGSHGGATAAGQVAVLASLGITEEQVGCPIRSSMDVVELGRLPAGEVVYTDRIAATEADLIVPVNRVRPHTDFHGPVESGLLKMLTLGLGKQRGADALHASGFSRFPDLVPAAGRLVLERLSVPFGIALVENGYGKLALLEAVPGEAIPAREPELLTLAREKMARLPVPTCDVLVIDWIGKDISGAGMDPNVVGRYVSGPAHGADVQPAAGAAVQRVVVLDLTPASEGNATGLGLADFCTERLAARVDRVKTYVNELTAKTPAGGRLPVLGRSDEEAIRMALASLRQVTPDAVRLLRIRSTKDLSEVWASAAILPEVLATGRAEVVEPLGAPAFDAAGNLL
ncbi:MAG: nickel pincer cofactor-dependent isomerase, group 22 [Symbiobacteriia bacterium]